jgi:hypothetical protein
LAEIAAFLQVPHALNSEVLGVRVRRGRPFQMRGLDLDKLKSQLARQPTARIGLSMFLSWVEPRSATSISSLLLTCR